MLTLFRSVFLRRLLTFCQRERPVQPFFHLAFLMAVGLCTACDGTPEPQTNVQVVVDPFESPTAASRQVIQGTKDKNTEVLVNGEVVVPLNSQIGWETSLDITDGLNVFYVSARDLMGNESTRVAVAIVGDLTAPPAPIVDAFDSFVDTSTVTLTGTKEEDASLFLDGEMVLAPVPPSATFSIELSLVEGVNTFSLSAIDSVGNESPATTIELVYGEFYFTLDPFDTLTNQTTMTFSGTRSAGVSVYLGELVVVEPADVADTWSYEAMLVEGTNTFNFTGSIENLSQSASAVIGLDTIPPSPPTLISPPEEVDTEEILLSGLKDAEAALFLDRGNGLEPFLTLDEGEGQTTFVNRPITLEFNTPTTLYLYAADALGNLSAPASPAPTVTYVPGPIEITLDDHVTSVSEPMITLAGDRPANVDIFLPNIDDENAASPADGTTRWSVSVPLSGGTNEIIIEGRRASDTAQLVTHVFYSEDGPQEPILTSPNQTILSSAIVSGTKPEDTSLLLNGEVVLSSSSGTSFIYFVDLNPGTNVFSWQTRDAFGRDSNAVLTYIEQATIAVDISEPQENKIVGDTVILVGSCEGLERPLKARFTGGPWNDVIGFSAFSTTLTLDDVSSYTNGSALNIEVAAVEDDSDVIVATIAVTPFTEEIQIAPVDNVPSGQGRILDSSLFWGDDDGLNITFSWEGFGSNVENVFTGTLDATTSEGSFSQVTTDTAQHVFARSTSPGMVIGPEQTRYFVWLETQAPYGISESEPGIAFWECTSCESFNTEPPLVLAGAESLSDDDAIYFSNATISIADTGRVAVAWVRHVPDASPRIEVKTYFDGVWSTSTEINPANNPLFTSEGASDLNIMYGPGEVLHLVWSDEGGLSSEPDASSSERDVYYRRLCEESGNTCEGSVISAIKLVSEGGTLIDGESTEPVMALDPSDGLNRAFVAWLEDGELAGDDRTMKKVALREVYDNPAGFGILLGEDIFDVSSSANREGASDVSIAVGPDGNAAVAFVEAGTLLNASNTDQEVYLRFYAGQLRELIPISQRDQSASTKNVSERPAVLIDPQSRLHIVWASSEDVLVLPGEDDQTHLWMNYFSFDGLSP